MDENWRFTPIKAKGKTELRGGKKWTERTYRTTHRERD
jgi:hypothetical protein